MTPPPWRILIVASWTLVLVACSPAPGAPPRDIPPAEPQPRVLPTVSDPDCCYLPSNPAPIGYRVPLAGSLLVGVVEVTRPATDLLLATNAANPSPPPGLEYWLVRVSVQCGTAPETPCDLSTGVQFLLEDPNGELYDAASALVEIPDPFDLAGIETGAIAEGNIAFLVPAGAQGLTVAFTWPNMTGVSLALE